MFFFYFLIAKCKSHFFINNVLQAWNFLKLPCDVDSKIEEHILWNNKLILIENKTVYNQRLVNKGIRKINDLLSANGSFFTMEDLLSKGLNMNDIFLVIDIIDALPDHWRVKIKNDNTQNKYHIK